MVLKHAGGKAGREGVYCVAGWQKNPPANIIISQPDSQPLLSSSQLFIHKNTK
jgi:hypothetical protein